MHIGGIGERLPLVRQLWGRFSYGRDNVSGGAALMKRASDDQMSNYHDEQAGSGTYAIGDLHDEVTLLRQLLERLAPCPDDTLIGDVRGTMKPP